MLAALTLLSTPIVARFQKHISHGARANTRTLPPLAHDFCSAQRGSDNEIKPPLNLFQEPRGSECELQAYVTVNGADLPIDSTLAVVHHNGTVFSAWVVCPVRLEGHDNQAGCGKYPMFWAELAGASFIAPVVVSVGLQPVGRVYRVGWRSHDAGAHELSVRHWGDSAYFKGRNTCGRKRAPPGRPDRHVRASPAQLTFIESYDEPSPLPLCGRVDILSAPARWLRESNGRSSGIFTPSHPSSPALDYTWAFVGCRLRDFTPRALIDEFLGPQHAASRATLHLHFVGESTMHYLCLALAGALSNHTREHRHQKYSDQAKLEGVRKVTQTEVDVGRTRLHCYSTVRATHPRGQADLLRELLAHQSSDDGANIFMVGDCGAYSACSTSSAPEARGPGGFESRRASATDGTRELIRQARRAVEGSSARVVWIAPAFTRKSYMQHVRRMHGDQLVLWRRALAEQPRFFAIDQRPMSHAVHPRFAFDGLHYHVVKSGDGAPVFYGGPVLFTSLRLVFNALLNRD